MFQRRERPNLSIKMRETVWPKSGWRRWALYMYKRVLRIAQSPHAIALGFSAGVFASFTPFIGFHFMIGLALAWVLGGSLIASAFGTAIGNPITFPAIWASTFHLGCLMLGRDPGSVSFENLGGGMLAAADAILPLIKPMVVGGAPLGMVVAFLMYFPVRAVVAYHQSRRMARLAAASAADAPGAHAQRR